MAHCHEGRSAHRVASIEDLLLPCHLKHLLDHAWDVILSHLVPGEVPKLMVEQGVWIEEGVVSAVSVSSVVAQPHVIASISKDIALPCYCYLLPYMRSLPSPLLGVETTQSAELQSSPC